jgi:predicted aldo/keto reductase-like oxidoreductase
MEPLRGGQLAKEPPPSVGEVWEDALGKHNRVEWALQWLWNQPEVSLLLSGMSTMEQVVENITYAGRSQVNSFSQEDLALFERIGKAYENLAPIPCTGCQYCLPCSNNVAIPRIFSLYNETFVTNDSRAGYFGYAGPAAIPDDQKADNCTECGECIELCPQKIDIPEWLKKAHQALTPDRPIGPPPGHDNFEE